jgi:hypothetical protein
MKDKQSKEKKAVLGKRSIAISNDLFQECHARMRDLKMATFSEYIRTLVRIDLNSEKRKAA